jgi:hypothetical protein
VIGNGEDGPAALVPAFNFREAAFMVVVSGGGVGVIALVGNDELSS